MKQLANTCEFKESDVLILDRIVLGVRDARIQEKLLQFSTLELNQALDICRSMESSVFTQREIAKEVNAVRKIDYGKKVGDKSVKNCVPVSTHSVCFSGQSGCRSGQHTKDKSGGFQDNQGKKYPCYRCGYQHDKGKCTAINRYCSMCRQKGHYRKFCPKKGHVHEINKDSSSDNESEGQFSENNGHNLVWTIQQDTRVDSIDWFEKVNVVGHDINLNVDTGSQVNILNFSDFEKLKIDCKQILPASSTLSSYTGHKVDVLGQIFLQCICKKITKTLLFYVLIMYANL